METIFRTAKSGTTDFHFRTNRDSTLGFACDRWENEHPLEAAASLGQEKTVNWLLRQQQQPLTVSHHTVTSAISVASNKGHSSVVQILLEYIAITSPSDIKQSEERMPESLFGEDAAFRLASAHCTRDEFAVLSRKYPLQARNYGAIKYRHKEVGEEETLLDFALSCKTGDIHLAASILETGHQELLSSRALDRGIELCGLHGQTTVAQLLLESPILRDRKPTPGEEAFVNAAARGFVDSMRLFILHWPQLLTAQEARNRALVVSSKGGHLAAVRYLVLELGADVNSLSSDWIFDPSLPASELSDNRTNSVNKSRKKKATATTVPFLSPLQASLLGFADVSNDLAPNSACTTNKRPRDANHQEVVRFLLHNGADPNDPGEQEVVPILVASKHCSPNIVQLLISAGADVNNMGFAEVVEELPVRKSAFFGKPSHLELGPPSSALFQAAGRELSGLPVVRLLIASGACFPEGVDGLSHLLGQALHFFESDGRFEFSSSLKEVFTEGPGSVLIYLLSRMPQAKATDKRWAMVLQMAASLGESSLVDLLLSRGVDVNATGHYYGTALQASARCGHTALVRKLLDAGAQVNLTGGRWHTPLRAALVDGHETIISHLLDHEADVLIEPSPSDRGYSSGESNTVLQLSVETGNINIVKGI